MPQRIKTTRAEREGWKLPAKTEAPEPPAPVEVKEEPAINEQFMRGEPSKETKSKKPKL